MKDDRVYLLHINDSIAKILKYTQEGKEHFLKDDKTHDAVIRNLEIIGEAVKRVSEEIKKQHPDIPWKSISGTRDKLIHEYFGVNLELLWDVVENERPSFQRKIIHILESK